MAVLLTAAAESENSLTASLSSEVFPLARDQWLKTKCESKSKRIRAQLITSDFHGQLKGHEYRV
ncbi:hypothetical protein Plim_1561 [Planctopirus limnophila DSM 3776]|uniref:Uncharacterized protein n=1 Tax=Planctopirus limnophila (strain ATCC 43296 / DSM 3776 / IFAM 1008 / Mu 290) TaxID=521674 RepID=D5SWP4_PLAL2|nr:hypothetical protein Plim_1561 [Planctopirus limnophila DSM 3776]